MELRVENIAKIQKASIELDGVTVLAGYNGSGKSTISKSLYAIIKAYIGIPKRIATARTNSILRIISDYIGQINGDLFSESAELFGKERMLAESFGNGVRSIPVDRSSFSQLLPEAFADADESLADKHFPQFVAQLREAVDRADIKYIEYLVHGTVREVFDGQINTLGSSSKGGIWLNDNAVSVYAEFEQNKIVECSENALKETAPIYIEPRHLLDDFSSNRRWRPYGGMMNFYRTLLHVEENEEDRTLEEHESIQMVLKLIDDILHGGLVSSDDGLSYVEIGCGEPVSLKNVASGNKTIAVLKRLIETRKLRKNSILIIDEPEMNLHPDWQLKLSEVLVLLNKELGIRVFLNTHSPYFVRAIEVYSEKYNLEEKCHYYKTEVLHDTNNMFCVSDVTGKTELIYRDLYMPLEEL